MFNNEDYNENIEYCRYVFERNEKIGLGLTNKREIQDIANRYVDELVEQNDGLEPEEIYEDDELLIKTITEYRKTEHDYEIDNAAKIKFGKQMAENDEENTFENERKSKIYGDHDFTDEYDDHGLDEGEYILKR